MHEPNVSVVICTYNRARYLPRALRSLLRQAFPAEAFEVIVVDNRSTDDTRKLVAAYAGKMDNLHYVYERRQGLSHARNRGVEAARAPLVAFLDDDAAADPGWLHALVTCFRTARPRPGCVGGPVRLDWEGPRPGWLPEAFLPLFTHLDLGPDRRRLDDTADTLHGANMAFDRDKLRRLGGFDPALGRIGADLLSGEETAVIERFKTERLGVYYEPEAGVTHLVLPERRTRAYLRRRLVADGRSQVACALADGTLTPDALPRRLAYDAKMLAAHLAGFIRHRLVGDPARAVHLRHQIPRRFGRMAMLVAALRKDRKGRT